MALDISISPVSLDDIPAMAKIAAISFETDRHTQMKDLGQIPYDMEKQAHSFLPPYVNSERCAVVKAVDETGAILGFAAWGFRGFKKEEIPCVDAAPRSGDEMSPAVEVEKPETVDGETEKIENDEGIKRLGALTDANMKEWQEKLMPEGTQCMYVCTLSVHPEYQRRGVGSALLKWGTDVADQNDIFVWVHSSMGAVKAYESSGFRPIGTLDVNLDEFAPCPPPVEVGGEKWGHYIFTYLKYEGHSKGV